MEEIKMVQLRWLRLVPPILSVLLQEYYWDGKAFKKRTPKTQSLESRLTLIPLMFKVDMMKTWCSRRCMMWRAERNAFNTLANGPSGFVDYVSTAWWYYISQM